MGCGPRRALQRLLFSFFPLQFFRNGFLAGDQFARVSGAFFRAGEWQQRRERTVTAAVSGLQRSRARRTRQVRLVK